ncbi:MAG: ribosome-associated translation inhibitor RaiA [Myxococcales bacterium]|jgi:putative sigma-54 modulation protein|nr:ribosome-associated translation inhibitor RaiA [Myxococcales bacterium]
MQVNITFRGIESTEGLKNHLQDRLSHLEKFFDRALEAQAVLSIERYLQNADITIYAGQYVLRGRVKSEDMYKSIDDAVEKIEKQLNRYKGRLRATHLKAASEFAAFRVRNDIIEVPQEEVGLTAAEESRAQEIEAEEWSKGPKIVTSHEILAEAMTVDEAIMQMDLADYDFRIFTNCETGLMNVLYRRKDGHLGLLEVAANKN